MCDQKTAFPFISRECLKAFSLYANRWLLNKQARLKSYSFRNESYGALWLYDSGQEFGAFYVRVVFNSNIITLIFFIWKESKLFVCFLLQWIFNLSLSSLQIQPSLVTYKQHTAHITGWLESIRAFLLISKVIKIT